MGWWVLAMLGWYAIAGCGSFAAYALDKRAALRGAWRTPERRLHAIDLAGGLLGGLLARRTLRHKHRKRGFVAISWAIILTHAAAWAFLGIGWATGGP